MSGIEKPNHDNKYLFYECECGRETEYGIYRYNDDETIKEWAILSCCGNCNSANNIKFCPFCGKKIEVKKELESVKRNE